MLTMMIVKTVIVFVLDNNHITFNNVFIYIFLDEKFN